MSRDGSEEEPREARVTLREQIAELLREEERDFESLRRELELSPRRMEEELTHLERSLRARGERLLVEGARCRQCDFQPRVRDRRRFHAPRRCPKCKAERMDPPSFRIE